MYKTYGNYRQAIQGLMAENKKLTEALAFTKSKLARPKKSRAFIPTKEQPTKPQA